MFRGLVVHKPVAYKNKNLGMLWRRTLDDEFEAIDFVAQSDKCDRRGGNQASEN